MPIALQTTPLVGWNGSKCRTVFADYPDNDSAGHSLIVVSDLGFSTLMFARTFNFASVFMVFEDNEATDALVDYFKWF